MKIASQGVHWLAKYWLRRIALLVVIHSCEVVRRIPSLMYSFASQAGPDCDCHTWPQIKKVTKSLQGCLAGEKAID